jgi:glucosamine--fructose-6-phosphate aminotransferase (isomerizing)
VDWRGYLLIALSQSGATPEVVTTCAAVRSAGAAVIGITNEPDSPLAGVVDLLLATDAGRERAIPATKTVTCQFALLATVAGALGARAGRAGGSGAIGAALAGLPSAVAAALADPGPARQLARRWQDIDRLVVAGRGLGYAAALETALKVAETTGVLATGMSTADLYHGPIAAVYGGARVLLVDGTGPADADLDELRQLLTSRGAETATLPVQAGLAEAAQAITAVVRGQQLAFELASLRGTDPDAPAHLTKVTATT